MPVQLVDVTYAPGSAPLIESLTLALHDQIRLGIVGENGSGKSTLLRLMSGDLRPERGEVVRKSGLRLVHVRQDDAAAAALSGTVADALFRSEPERDLERLGKELAVASERGDQRRLDEIGRAYDDAVSALASAVVPDRALALDLLGDLGLRGLGEERRLSELSGGQRRLIELTRSLALQPDLLLLDEPEAHLDLRARGLLAERLASWRGALVVVSHDRHLLDRAVKEIVDLSGGRVDHYAGAYSFYLEERPRRLAQREHEHRTATANVQRLEQQYHQLREWATMNDKFAARARSRKRMLDRARADVEKPVPRPSRVMALSFSSDARGRIMAEAESAIYSYATTGSRVGPINLVLERGDRVALLGPNGAGKSTLLRLFAGQLAAVGGRVRVKDGARVALMTQESLTEELDRTPLQLIVDAKPMAQDDAVRRICALGLRYAHCTSPMGRLSGGQRVRVHLLRASLAQPDLLLLDEPTNYIDTQSAEVVQSELERFTGCVVAATHDRFFVETFATRVVTLDAPRDGHTKVSELTIEELERSFTG
jgi:ATP-binding cassette subfamily F protein 3